MISVGRVSSPGPNRWVFLSAKRLRFITVSARGSYLSSLPSPFLPYLTPFYMQCGNRSGVSLFLSVPLAFRFLTARCSSTKLFVGGLCYDTNETVLKNFFTSHGDVIEVKVICDHVSGKSKGYGFVKFGDEAAASAALNEMNGQLLEGRNIRIEYARKM